VTFFGKIVSPAWQASCTCRSAWKIAALDILARSIATPALAGALPMRIPGKAVERR
jgi:hypothetical protein